ncbi:tetraacyldisaccharide 4'-kinase [Allochromatium palmeri]|uniref:Tetraacyldisaccharide 4'-kinase n=1 Tax=Allochromatium palmeri TaxID=231048 RepID=A0A6N8E9R6_9GAMM|nr:tetraacyldisaccharide 4'-kinase [Allochromatium palmeri]MTW20885.1 tetraacyldisaccharide 4'-kinase [Allochromatium palmeri]
MRLNPTDIWYGHDSRHPLTWLLRPLSWLYGAIVRVRRLAYLKGWRASERLPVPVVLVGNLTVGGTGKTPLVLHLVALLRTQGWNPAIITRGYGGRAEHWPQQVRPESDPDRVGDEPVLLARRSGCVVVAGPDRIAAGRLAIELSGCDILVSDDGLQHYRLARDLEIVLIDGVRGFGNGFCLPAGPLREPPARLNSVDLVLYKGGTGQGLGQRMQLRPGALVNLRNPTQQRPLADLSGQPVRAVAGIGDPEPFFRQLESVGLVVERWPYPDHYRYRPEDGECWRGLPVIMTEKDAVKCTAFAEADHWWLPVEAVLDPDFESRLRRMLDQLRVSR